MCAGRTAFGGPAYVIPTGPSQGSSHYYLLSRDTRVMWGSYIMNAMITRHERFRDSLGGFRFTALNETGMYRFKLILPTNVRVKRQS